jgi:hypothetical protein
MNPHVYAQELRATHGLSFATGLSAKLFHTTRMAVADSTSVTPLADECEYVPNPKGGHRLVVDEVAKLKRLLKTNRFWENVFMILRKAGK